MMARNTSALPASTWQRKTLYPIHNNKSTTPPPSSLFHRSRLTHSLSLYPTNIFSQKPSLFATVSKLNNPIIPTIPLPLFNSTPTSSHSCTTRPFSQTLSLGLFPSSLFPAKTMAPKLSLILCVLAMWAVGISHGASSHHAPAPSVDCSSLVLTMADCLSYVTNGSTTTKPEGTCCSGLKSVLKTAPQCLCEAFKSSAQFGVVLNVTKAMTLPSACKVSASSATDCGLTEAPAAAPAGSHSPQSSPAPTSGTAAPALNRPIGELSPAPAPSPGNAASALFPISAGSLILCLLVAVFSGF